MKTDTYTYYMLRTVTEFDCAPDDECAYIMLDRTCDSSYVSEMIQHAIKYGFTVIRARKGFFSHLQFISFTLMQLLYETDEYLLYVDNGSKLLEYVPSLMRIYYMCDFPSAISYCTLDIAYHVLDTTDDVEKLSEFCDRAKRLGYTVIGSSLRVSDKSIITPNELCKMSFHPSFEVFVDNGREYWYGN